MAWPPLDLPTNKTNQTAQLDDHPAAHNATNGTINEMIAGINLMRQYPIVARTFIGVVTTNGNGDFAVTTGYTPLGAFCIGTQSDYPFHFTTIIWDAIQIAWRVRNVQDGVPVSNAPIGIMYMSLGMIGSSGVPGRTAEEASWDPSFHEEVEVDYSLLPPPIDTFGSSSTR